MTSHDEQVPPHDHLHLDVELGFGGPVTALRGRRADVLDELRILLRPHLARDLDSEEASDGFALTSPVPLPVPTQQVITDLVHEEARARSDEWDDRDDNITLVGRFGPMFSGGIYGPQELGIWTDPQTFTLARLGSGLNGLRAVWAEVHHWQPNSMVSGSFFSTLGLLAPGVIVVDRHEDEDGDFYSIERADTDPRGIAAEVEAFLSNVAWEWEWRPNDLLKLWALGFPIGPSGPAVPVVLLTSPYEEDWDNEYEVDGFELRLPPEAEAELRRMSMPSAEERAHLLEAIQRYDARGGRWRLAEIDPAWQRLEERLREG